MTITSKTLAVWVVSILFGGIFFSSLMGWWQTESRKIAAVFNEGEFAGQANPADIRGSYTFGDVEKNFGVPAAILAAAFDVQSDAPAGFAVKELETLYAEQAAATGIEVGTSSVRLFVAFYTGLPFDLATDIYLPAAAAPALAGRELDAERQAYLASHLLPAASDSPTPTAPALVESAPAGAATPAPAQPTSTHAPVSSSDRMIKGKTTFSELLGWGLTQPAIEEVLGMPLPAAPGMTVKDFCTANNLSFETVKPALQALVDQLK